MGKLGKAGHKPTLEEARRRFKDHVEGKQVLPADLRSPVRDSNHSRGSVFSAQNCKRTSGGQSSEAGVGVVLGVFNGAQTWRQFHTGDDAEGKGAPPGTRGLALLRLSVTACIPVFPVTSQ